MNIDKLFLNVIIFLNNTLKKGITNMSNDNIMKKSLENLNSSIGIVETTSYDYLDAKEVATIEVINKLEMAIERLTIVKDSIK